jgi:hypothetical protein
VARHKHRERERKEKRKKRNDRRWQIKPLISARATYPVKRHWYETKASLEGPFWPLELAWRAIRRWPLWALERDLKPFHIYTLCSHEKSYVFSMWDLKPISIYTLCSKKKVMFFQYGIQKFNNYETRNATSWQDQTPDRV